MQIEKINIKNFKGIGNFEGDIHGKNVFLVGGNGTGKTSFIDAVWFGLTGKNAPREITKDGAKTGLIELDLGDFIARTKLKKGKPVAFEIENKEYSKETDRFIKAPRTFLEERIGMLTFDIKEFFAKSDAERVKYFAKVMGEDFSDIDSDIEEVIESRKFDKRKLTEIKGLVNYYDPKDAEKELTDVVDLTKKIEAENGKKSTFDKVSEGVNDRKARVLEIDAQIMKLQIERDGSPKGSNIDVRGLINEISDGESWLNSESNKADTDLIEQMRKEINSSNEINDKIREAKENHKNSEKVEELESAIKEANEEVTELREQKAKRISDKINIEGLSYNIDGDCFLWNGLPFDSNQINTASQLIAGMKIAAMMLKDLKILKVDASLIDENNFDLVQSWAAEEGIELFVELVDRNATELQIIIHDDNDVE
jgi:DNA repair exonuclease SbcCD ATPase subunit